VQRRSWHDPERWAPDFNAMSDDALVVRAQNWEALCLYGWYPYMYNPQLKRWLSHAMTNWIGDDGMLHKLTCEIRRHNPEGDTLFIHGSVTNKYASQGELSARGTAVVQLPSRTG
jgi:hypothetical protein